MLTAFTMHFTLPMYDATSQITVVGVEALKLKVPRKPLQGALGELECIIINANVCTR